jgi:hypothetical protein
VRLGSTRIEELPPGPFVFLVGAVGGVLQVIPEFLSEYFGIASALSGQLVVNLAAIVLWWTAVRRRRSSVWWTAWHLTLALALAQVLAVLLSLAIVNVRVPLADLVWPMLTALLGLSPIRFLGSAVLVAVGRLLPGSGTLARPRAPTPNDPAAVT